MITVISILTHYLDPRQTPMRVPNVQRILAAESARPPKLSSPSIQLATDSGKPELLLHTLDAPLPCSTITLELQWEGAVLPGLVVKGPFVHLQ